MAKVVISSKKFKINKPTIIQGFQGIGLVGTLSAQYMIKELKAKQIGYVDSDALPPVAVLSEGEIKHPIRMYGIEKPNVIFIESELPIPKDLVFRIASTISKWAKKNNAKQIISIEGIANENVKTSPKVFLISNDKMTKKQEKMYSGFNIKSLTNGIVMGASAAILLESKEENVPAFCIMAESQTGLPDGKAAAAIIQRLNSILGLKVNTRPLLAEAAKFEKKVKKVVEKTKQLETHKDAKDIMFG